MDECWLVLVPDREDLADQRTNSLTNWCSPINERVRAVAMSTV